MISAWFCSVIIAALPAHSYQAVWMDREFFYPEQNHTAKPNCTLSVYHLMIVVLTEIIIIKYSVLFTEKKEKKDRKRSGLLTQIPPVS